MTQPSHPARPSHRAPSRLPPFYPVPNLKPRHDGWTHRRQADFIGHLAETGSVAAACRQVGMSREAAYRLRRRPGAQSFAAAWDAALGAPAGKLTGGDLEQRALRGAIRPIMHGGKYVGVRRKPDNSALLRLVARFDRMLANLDEPPLGPPDKPARLRDPKLTRRPAR